MSKTTAPDTRPWTADDDGLLALLTFRMVGPVLIGKVLKRTPAAIRHRKKVLGIVTPAKCRRCDTRLEPQKRVGRPVELCPEHRRVRNTPAAAVEAAPEAPETTESASDAA